MTHISSGSDLSEVDAALHALATLAENKPKELAQYTLLLRGILDYLSHLKLRHVRQYFSILTQLSLGSEVRDSPLAMTCTPNPATPPRPWEQPR
jgi:hypothetical protein